MGDPDNCCRISGAAELTLVDSVLDEFSLLCARIGDVSDDERDQFSLAVSELLTNMITHGETDDASGVRIDACLCVRPDRLTGTLSDTAQEAEVVLDDVRMPDPMAESGRGLAISTMILDSLEHTTDTGNVWSFWRSRGH